MIEKCKVCTGRRKDLFGHYCGRSGEHLDKLSQEYKRDCNRYEGVKACKKRLLKEEIKLTEKKLRRLKKELSEI